MLCDRVKLKLVRGANPTVINEIIKTVSAMDNELFKSYSYRNGTLYIKLGYRSEKCNEIVQAMTNIYDAYYDDDKVLN